MFTYLPVFEVIASSAKRAAWSPPTFPGFQAKNPNGYQDFTWNDNFGMTAFMTPVNEAFNPLPTRVLYVWKPDSEYSVFTDRAQDTKMMFTYNPPNSAGLATQVALLTGPAPAVQTGPINSDESFLINYYAEAQIYYEELTQPIDPANFVVPACCSLQTRKMGLRRRLP